MSDIETSNWTNLPSELLEIILTKLSSINIQNFQAVCPPWRNAAKSYTSSSSYTHLHHVPWLLLPKTDKDGYDFRFFSLEDEKVIRRINRPRDLNIPEKFYNSLCLGSSYGWLVMLDEMATPYLFDPFYLTQIQLPNIDTIELFKFSKSDDGGFDLVPYYGSTESLRHFNSVHDLRGYFFSNAVVSSNFYHNREFYVLMIASFDNAGSQLMFFRSGGCDVWMLLGDYDQTYSDIVCYDDRFYALNSLADKVELWDTTIYTPELDEEFVVPMPPVLPETRSLLENCTSCRTYLVKSCEDLLLVLRYIGDFVDGDQGEDIYKTLVFEVFKLDFSINEWVQVESLGDQVLFLGGVQSISHSIQDFPACQANSIYFTDDCWARIHEHNVRYDIGIFRLEDKSIKAFHQCDLGTEPPPIWVDPKVMLESWAWNAKHYVR